MQRSSSDPSTSRDAAQIPALAATPSSPFAWDEPAAEEEAEGLEPAALQDWYRYIDSLARPARRPQDELDLDDEEEAAPEGISRHGAIETRRDTEVGTIPKGAQGDHSGRPSTSELAHEAVSDEAAAQPEAPRQPPYLSWGEPWTPPVAVPLDDETAQAIVAQLAPEVPEAPPVDWEPVSAEVPVPDLTEFIPALDAVEPPPRTTQELLATVPAPPPAEPRAADASAPASPFTAPALEAGAPWQPPPGVHQELSAASSSGMNPPAPTPPGAFPPVTTTALVRVTTPDEERRPAGETARRGEPPVRPVTEGTPSSHELPSIGTIRERLPRHMERLLQVPTSEVAQNSYKSPFKETREELIQRLLDPSLTLEEAARLLGVCPTTVRRYTNKGLLHHFRTPGNQRRFRLSDVLSFLDEHGGTWLLEDRYGGDESELEDPLAAESPG